jgi:hypothetical protein
MLATLVGVVATWLVAALVRAPAGGPAASLPRPYLALVALVLMAGSAENLAIFAHVSASVQATRVPIAYLAAFTGSAAAWAAYLGARGVGRVMGLLMPLIVLGLLIVYASPLINFDWQNIARAPGRPAWPPDPVTLASLGVVRGFLVLLVWRGQGTDLRPMRAAVLWGQAAAGLLITASAFISQGVLGVPLAQTLRFPFVATSGTVQWQWLPTSSLLTLLMVVWQAVAFCVVAAYIALATDALRQMLPVLGRRSAFALAVAATAAAAIDVPAAVIDTVTWLFNAAVLAVGLVLPALVLVARRRPAAVAGPRVGPA